MESAESKPLLTEQKETPAPIKIPGLVIDEPIRLLFNCPHCTERLRLCIDPDKPDAAPEPTDADPEVP